MHSYATKGSGIRYYWQRSIETISKEIWDACFGDENALHSYGLAKAVERSKIKEMEFHYLIGERNEKAVFILPCFCLRITSAAFASPAYRRFVEVVHRVVPDVLSFRFLFAGSPITIRTHYLGLRQLPDHEHLQLLREVREALLRRCEEVNAQIVLIKEFEQPWPPVLKPAFEPEFLIAKSLPTAYVPVSGAGSLPYQERLRSPYRKRMKRQLRRFREMGLRWERLYSFGHCVDDLHDLYLQVLEKSAFRFETLTPDFFREVSESFDNRSYVLIAYEDDKAVAFMLFLEDQNWLHGLKIGMDYEYRNCASLYYNCLLRFINECEQRGYPVADLGQTTYEVKGQLGGVVSPRYFCLHHRNRAIHWIIRAMGAHIFPSPQMLRYRVFSDNEMVNWILDRRDLYVERTDD